MSNSPKSQLLPPTSLLKQVSLQDQYFVWILTEENQLLKISLSSGCLTVNQAIREAVHKFNSLFSLKLKEETSVYELYGARKNGKKKSDFPSLEYEQTIENTKLHRFHLVPLFGLHRKHSQQSTMTSIQGSMEMEKKTQPKEIKAKKGFGCLFCPGK